MRIAFSILIAGGFMTVTKHFVFALSVGVFSACTCSAVSAQTATGTPINNDPNASTANPRVVRISHGEEKGTIVASVAPGMPDKNGVIYKSKDEGATFSQVTELPLRPGTRWKCCGTLFELPQQVGALKSGTLLFSATFCVGAAASIDVYSSSDEGNSWAYHSTPVQRGLCNNKKSKGIWEPQFEVDSRGSLVLFWSDETDPCCSQKLAQMRSTDGATWEDEKNTVASEVQADRPGMAVVSKLPSGIYFMTYEMCGTEQCAVSYRTSRDGWNFGSPSDLGKIIATASGQYFEHAPTNRWIPAPRSPWASPFQPEDGTLLVVGQMLYENDGKISPQSGQVLLVNHSRDGSGNWDTIPAPVRVNDPADTPYNPCQNYSSVLLPTKDGSVLLEMASDYNGTIVNGEKICTSYYASEPWTRD
jgi:hypothetical protein